MLVPKTPLHFWFKSQKTFNLSSWVTLKLCCFLFLSVCWYFLARWSFNQLQYFRTNVIASTCRTVATKSWSRLSQLSWHILYPELFWGYEGNMEKLLYHFYSQGRGADNEAKGLHQKPCRCFSAGTLLKQPVIYRTQKEEYRKRTSRVRTSWTLLPRTTPITEQ